MKDKQKACGGIARRCQKAGKKGRGKLPDGYTVTPGYNRDCLAHILSNRGKALSVRAEGKPVKITAAPVPQRSRKARKMAPQALNRAAESRSTGEKPFTALPENIRGLSGRL
jgi:hypothetical protein